MWCRARPTAVSKTLSSRAIVHLAQARAFCPGLSQTHSRFAELRVFGSIVIPRDPAEDVLRPGMTGQAADVSQKRCTRSRCQRCRLRLLQCGQDVPRLLQRAAAALGVVVAVAVKSTRDFEWWFVVQALWVPRSGRDQEYRCHPSAQRPAATAPDSRRRHDW